jgi:3-oxoacyl-[acyl-carrier-protein] synthase III
LPEGSIEATYGLKSRFRVKEETMLDLGAMALQNALDDANCTFEDIDLLISSSVSISYILPNNATMIAQHMKKDRVPCMDVNQSCQSWLAALEMASGLLQTNRYRRIAIVSAETPSKILNPKNIETHILFGDAAAAVIIERSEDPNLGIVKSLFRTYPDGWNLSLIPGGGLVKHPLHHEVALEDNTFQMQNQRILLYSLKKMKEYFAEFLTNELTFDLIDKIVPHQGSRAGLDFFVHHFGVSDKIVRNFETRGNCVAASIPLAFCEAIKKGEIQKGQRVLLAGTAAGISIGGILIQI